MSGERLAAWCSPAFSVHLAGRIGGHGHPRGAMVTTAAMAAVPVCAAVNAATDTRDTRRLRAANIRLARSRTDLSQDDVADRLGITRNEVSRWETGRRSPTRRNRAALADVLKVDVTFFDTEHPAEEDAP